MARVPDDAVEVDLDTGTASLLVTDLQILDQFNLLNALRGGPSVPAVVSFEVHWGDPLRRLRLRNRDIGFEGQFIENKAAIAWSASQDGFAFASDAAATSRSTFAVIGHERNGAFFPLD